MGRRGQTARREPKFDVEGPNRELRADPEIRLPADEEAPPPKPKKKRKPKPKADGSATSAKKPAKSKEKRRSLVGRTGCGPAKAVQRIRPGQRL